ncbi:di-N-acetylchitobiase-like isoform X2 [Narcine bancroftii]|uniref:di-N-acetylchitobiase-like isoform X2 n=1 Tax=Narcine bancroftii TaxID=1343680 RepID=UPI003831A841
MKGKSSCSSVVEAFPVRQRVWGPDNSTPTTLEHWCSGPPRDHTRSSKSRTLEASHVPGRARGCTGAVSNTFLRVPTPPTAALAQGLFVQSGHPRMCGSTLVDFIKKPAPSCGDKTGASIILSLAGVLCGLEFPNENSVVPTGQVVAIDFGGKDWKHYDWAKVTTIVLTRDVDPELVCYAHSKNIRVVKRADVSLDEINRTRAQRKWMRINKYLITRDYLDGINVNILPQIATNSKEYYALNVLMEDLVQTYHRDRPGSQVSVTLPWSPDCTDGQCCDYLNISRTCDFVFVRSYNIPQDMRYGCIAHPPAPYHQVLSGLSAFIRLGIDSRKLVMGVPWYGYDYTCQPFVEAGFCALGNVSYRGTPCSARNAHRLYYKDIMNLLPRSITGRIWDDVHKAPFFVYMNGTQYHEVWYDDPESISMRATFLKKLKLGGIGMWAANSLNYSGDARTWIQTEEMWNALCPP